MATQRYHLASVSRDADPSLKCQIMDDDPDIVLASVSRDADPSLKLHSSATLHLSVVVFGQ